MDIVLHYTIRSGDSYYSIAEGLAAAAGVTGAQVEAANPTVTPSTLQVGQVIAIPKTTGTGTALSYTIRSGDTLWDVAANISRCAGVTWQVIEAANPEVPASSLRVGQVVGVPAAGDQPVPEPVPTAETMGYWNLTWAPKTALTGATMGLAFSGWIDPAKALTDSARVYASLAGTKFITLGGGRETGAYRAGSLAAINAAITDGSFKDYRGIAYDVEIGDDGLAAEFAESFAIAKAAGFAVLVTVSHSAPYDIGDGADLMDGFFKDGNIDYLSPQLYTQGTETANDYAISLGVTWTQYAAAKAKIVPSIVSAGLYDDAVTTFAGHGVTLAGYIRWGDR